MVCACLPSAWLPSWQLLGWSAWHPPVISGVPDGWSGLPSGWFGSSVHNWSPSHIFTVGTVPFPSLGTGLSCSSWLDVPPGWFFFQCSAYHSSNSVNFLLSVSLSTISSSQAVFLGLVGLSCQVYTCLAQSGGDCLGLAN